MDLSEEGIKQAAEVTKQVTKFVMTLLGPAATQLGELLGDTARSWRLKNLLSISDKVDAICREKGFNPESGQKMALSIGLPLIAKASYQDDDFLQDKWANLLVASMEGNMSGFDPEGAFSFDATCIEALGQFSRLDCYVLEYIVENGIAHQEVPSDGRTSSMLSNPIPENTIEQALSEYKLVHLSIDKLVHIGCADRVLRLPLSPKKEGESGLHRLAEGIAPTMIGINLYVASSGKTPKWAEREPAE